LADAKLDKNKELAEAYEAAIKADVTYNGNVFQAGDRTTQSIEKINAFRKAGGVLDPSFSWRAKDNTPIAFTYADIDGLVLAISAVEFTAVDNLHTKKDAVIAAADVAAVNAITWA
jgi:hypothetical protein